MESKEAAENKIDLSEDPQDAVGAMIQFFYHSKYDTPDAGPSRFELHMSVYFLADKYLLQKLSEYSKSRILEQLRWSLDNYTSGRVVTTRIKAIYAQTNDRDNMLRARAVRMFEPHAEKFFADVQRFRALADAAPDFVSSLIQELAKHGAPPNITPGLPIYRCPGCKTNFRSDMKKADSRFFTHGLGRGCRYELSEKEWQAHRV